MSVKQRTVNIRPFAIDIDRTDTGLNLLIEARRVKVRVQLERWWIGAIADEIHRYLDAEEKMIFELRDAMNGHVK